MKENCTILIYFRQLFHRIPLLIVALLLISQTDIYAQGVRTISGIVVDETGEPLPGASVVQKRANKSESLNAVIVDIHGHFSLTLANSAQEIEISYLGYETKTVKLTSEMSYRIDLKPSSEMIEEVVVTGAFTRKANTYTGSVTTVKGDDLLKVGNQNLLSSLANIDPSFTLLDNLAAGSNPNALPDFQMRGQTGFSDLKGEYESNPNQPLFILDGFETDLTKIIDLDMNMVASVTLLKDATAKAIYGSKAANGVIVVETKRPEAGRMKVYYTGGLSIEMPDLSSYDLTNAAEKLQVEKMAGLYTSDNAQTQIAYQQEYEKKLREVLAGVNTDWKSQPVRTGIGQKHSVYLDGGDQHMVYGVDLSYNNIQGVMKGSNRNTFSGGVTLAYRLKKFQFRNKLSITYNESNDSPWGSFSTYTQMNPYSRLYDEKGQLIQSYQYVTGGSKTANPIWDSTINTVYLSKYTDITNNFYAEWNIQNNLKLTGRLGLSKKNTSTDNFRPASHTNFINYESKDLYRKGTYYKANGDNFNINGDLGISYSVQLKKHLIFLNGQVNFTNYTYNLSAMQAEGFPNDNMDHIIFGVQYDTETGKPTGNEGISRSVGGIGSINYSFDDRFLFDANYRLSGSSEFGANSRWGSFWSLGAGWNIHNEAFLKDNAWINQLKLRLSTGYTGSQGFSTYEALATVKYYGSSSYNGNIGSYLVGLANPDLRWQKKYDNSVGLDFTVMNKRINGRFDYYTSTTKGMLTDITVPQSTGFATYRENMGETENKGYEAYLNARVWENKENRSYINVFTSLARNKNKIKKISNSLRKFNEDQDANKNQDDDEKYKTSITTPSVRFEEGQSMSAIWAVRSLGIDPENGKEIYLKKDGSVTYEWNAADQVVCGDTQPEFNGNFGFNAEVNGFGFGTTFSYRVGGQIYNSTLINKVENASPYYNVDRRVFTDRWQKPGDVALYKAITDKSYTRPTSRFVEDYNTLTLSSINVYYDFRNCNFMKRCFLERLKVSAYMNDVFVVSSVKTERGTNYPFARTISFAVQASF
ncbi:SusC/RagA family TonB-linked outer membrane protein [Bacteroides reticulotermitis]|uniref:TonB-linked SusC/RagA family outer membrane protein n=1 Tax=Bacteroides reticulotermitis TaxID=1133319 RepID=A0A840D2I7_9BACE|nr:SusC/RagA family TonB-linked outer membrane protein [Bacteroides reticulotermitis]MBB4042955.1 TonB-linked SusC/RagA family outer membrane protein [Bacteroides reticulotermitis]